MVRHAQRMQTKRNPCVYILASGHYGTLYIGVTSDLLKRLWQHRSGTAGGFTSRYDVTRLIHFELFGDMELIPIRGQLAILIPQPEVHYAFTGEAGYMFPRPDGIVIGGSYERNIWEAEPQPERIARIVASHQQLFAGFRCPA